MPLTEQKQELPAIIMAMATGMVMDAGSMVMATGMVKRKNQKERKMGRKNNQLN